MSCRSSIVTRAGLLCVSQLMGFALCAVPQKLPLNTVPTKEATAAIQGDKFRLSNDAIEAEWRFHENGLVATTLTDHFTNRTISLVSSAFVVALQDGTVLKSSEMQVIALPRLRKLDPDPNASQRAARFGGWQIEVGLADSGSRL